MSTDKTPSAKVHTPPVKTSIDTLQTAAWDMVKAKGWTASARLSLHQVTGLMAELAMQAYRGEIGCGYPDCGCCADAACEDAIKQHPDFRPSPEPHVPGMSRELMGKIVDEVFGGAIEDASVIEEIYAVIKSYELDRGISAIIADDTPIGPGDAANIAMVKRALAGGYRNPNWESDNVELERALDAFWNAAYTQGQENRGHDDTDGTAQKADDELRRVIAALSSPPAKVHIPASDEAAQRALDTFKDRMWRDGELPAMRAALETSWPEPHLLHIAVGAVLEADTEFRSNMPKEWEGDPLSDEIDGLRRIFEAMPAAPNNRARGTSAEYINRLTGKPCTVISDDNGTVTFKPHGSDTVRYLGYDEFQKRFQAIVPARIAPHIWQPIATAPRDGTFILTRVGHFRPAVSHWACYAGTSRWGADPEEFMEEDHFLQYWQQVSYDPTHWMHLPDFDDIDAIDTAYSNGTADGFAKGVREAATAVDVIAVALDKDAETATDSLVHNTLLAASVCFKITASTIRTLIVPEAETPHA